MRRRVAVEVLGSIFVLRGWQAHKLAIEAGLRPTYSGVHQGWMADTSRLSTFEAYCAHRYVSVDVTGVPEPSPIDLALVMPAVPPDAHEPADVALFELDGGR